MSFSKVNEVPQEPFLMKGEMPHGDVSDAHSAHEVFLSFGVTTDPSLWPLSPGTDDKKTHKDTTSQHTLIHHPQNTQPALYNKTASVSGCEGLAAVPAPALDGAQERKTKVDRKCPVDQPSQWETLVQEVVSADQSLACALYPIANRKTAVMLMEQMLSEDNLLMEDHYKKKHEQKVATPEQTTYR